MILLDANQPSPTAIAPSTDGYPTYETLDAAVSQLQRKDVATLRSTLNVWRDVRGLTPLDPIGPEFTSGYADAITAFCVARSGNVSASTLKSDRSRMGVIQKLAASLLKSASWEVTGTFGERLRAVKAQTKIIWRTAAEAIGVPKTTLVDWANGICLPRPHIRSQIPVLEAVFGVAAGTLTSALPESWAGSRYDPDVGGLRTPFAVRLVETMTAAGRSIGEVAEALGCPRKRISEYRQGQLLTGRRAHDEMPKIEAYLKLKPGTLSELLPPTAMSQYTYSLPLNSVQEGEWQKFFHHKTDKEQADPDRRPLMFWRVHVDGSCPTGKLNYTRMMRYLGWLAHEGPADLQALIKSNPEQVGLVDWARADAVTGFVRWLARRKEQHAPHYNMGHIGHLAFACSILRKQSGYLWQAYEVDFGAVAAHGICLGADGGVPTLVEWRAHCEATFDKLFKFRTHLEEQGLVEKAKENAGTIGPILLSDRPMDFLLLMVVRMRADLPRVEAHVTYGTRAARMKLAIFRRDLLLIEMLTTNPLRLRNWITLTYSPVNTGQLRRAEDGHYTLHIPKEEIKATAAFRDHDYTADVPQALTGLLRTYLTDDRPLLIGASACSFVFRPSRLTTGTLEGALFTGLAQRIHYWSGLYLRKELQGRGFRTHAVRHIIATHFVKQYGEEGLILAADALHNTPMTVKNHYGHLIATDHTRRAHKLIAREYENAADVTMGGAR